MADYFAWTEETKESYQYELEAALIDASVPVDLQK